MTLRALNRLAEAEAFAYEWRERAPENMKIYLDVATALLSQDPPPRLDTQVIARIVPVVMAQRFPDAAQALGWYSYNTEQIRTARDWFRTALSWKADDEPSAYGLALSTQRLNDRGGFNAVVAQWRSRSQRIADLADGVNPATRQAVVAQPAVPQPAMTAPLPWLLRWKPHHPRSRVMRPARSRWSGSRPNRPSSGPRTMCAASAIAGAFGSGAQLRHHAQSQRPLGRCGPDPRLVPDGGQPSSRGGRRLRPGYRQRQQPHPGGGGLWQVPRLSAQEPDRGSGRGGCRGASDPRAPGGTRSLDPDPAGAGRLPRRTLRGDAPRPERAGPARARAERPAADPRLVLFQARTL